MLVQAFRDGLAPGPGGYIDDCLAELRPYGFRIHDVAVTTRVMLARQDDSLPARHGEWRVEPEEHLMAWVGGHSSRGPAVKLRPSDYESVPDRPRGGA